MTRGASSPKSFPDWMLSVMDRLCQEGLACDGLRPEAPEAEAEVTFAGATIVRSSGSWLDDGLSIGLSLVVLGSDSNDGSYDRIIGLTASTITMLGTIGFVDEGPTANVTITGSRPANGIALYHGREWQEVWETPPCVWFRPIRGELGGGESGAGLKTHHTATRQRQAIASLFWAVEIRVWGIEPDTARATGYLESIERLRDAFEIIDNVVRVCTLSAAGYGKWIEVPGWEGEGVTSHGESAVLLFAVPVTVYDYPKPLIPALTPFVFETGNPVVVRPGE